MLTLEPGGTNGVTVRWPVVEGHVYLLHAGYGLVNEGLGPSFGPTTAAVEQVSMQWLDVSGASATSRFYRLSVPLP